MGARVMQSMLPMSPAPKRVVRGAVVRAQLESSFEEIGAATAALVRAQQALCEARTALRPIWEMTQPDECPEFELEARGRVHRNA